MGAIEYIKKLFGCGKIDHKKEKNMSIENAVTTRKAMNDLTRKMICYVVACDYSAIDSDDAINNEISTYQRKMDWLKSSLYEQIKVHKYYSTSLEGLL